MAVFGLDRQDLSDDSQTQHSQKAYLSEQSSHTLFSAAQKCTQKQADLRRNKL
jgi:hypothetical protein